MFVFSQSFKVKDFFLKRQKIVKSEKRKVKNTEGGYELLHFAAFFHFSFFTILRSRSALLHFSRQLMPQIAFNGVVHYVNNRCHQYGYRKFVEIATCTHRQKLFD